MSESSVLPKRPCGQSGEAYLSIYFLEEVIFKARHYKNTGGER